MDKREDRMIAKSPNLKGEFIDIDTCCYLVSSFYVVGDLALFLKNEVEKFCLTTLTIGTLLCAGIFVVSSLVALIFCLGVFAS